MKDDSDKITDFSQYDVIIPSPGIPSHHNVYKTNKVKSELDFAFGFLPKDFHIIAVTGTDGKSTTSWILYELLRQEFGDAKVYLSGNFDVPFSQTVREILEKKQKHGYIVLEVSSFMSYSLEQFEAEYTIFTNFKPDHLNWHKDLEDYFLSKMNLLYHTRKKSIVNEQVIDFAKEHNFLIKNSLNLRKYPSRTGVLGQRLSHSKDEAQRLRDRVEDDNIIISGRKKYKLSETHFSGIHNALNILSATLVTNEMGICSKRTKEYLKNITGLPHRIEFVSEKNGVRFIDDSKSTSCQSLVAALTAFEKQKTILIAGGSDKGDEFEDLEGSLEGLKYAVLIGATREILAKKCDLARVKYSFADSMEEAVKLSWNLAKREDTILLSPGCASFGLFRDYLDRAEKFRESIKKLP